MFCRYKAVISYDGYDYYGFQHQEGYDTIESCLNIAFKDAFKLDVKIVGSGRTDRFVHAIGQVIHFDLPFIIKEENLVRALNTYLPLSIRIKHIDKVATDFHARFNATKKTYAYTISLKPLTAFNYRYMTYYKNLDLNLAKEALTLLEGTHDFKALCSADIDKRKPTIKTIYEAKMIQNEEYISFIFTADGFLKYQIRRMVGLIIDISLKKKTLNDLIKIIESKDPRLSHRIVDGKGLCLVEVNY